jgi:hypothetical protein
VSPKYARSLATTKSQPRASSNPPVMAGPLTAAITGLPTSRSAWLNVSCERSVHDSSVRSMPAQNAGSVPVSTATRAESSAANSRRVAASAASSSRLSALRLAGRSSVIS